MNQIGSLANSIGLGPEICLRPNSFKLNWFPDEVGAQTRHGAQGAAPETHVF